MKKNIGKFDQVMRFMFVNLYIILPILEEGMPSWLITFYIINAIALAITGVLAYCPMYRWLGLDKGVAMDGNKEEIIS